MKNLKNGMLILTLSLIFAWTLVSPHKAEAVNPGDSGSGSGDAIYVLLSNETGTKFCCCPGQRTCGSECCSGC
jgi:hypothetical protein